MASTIDKFLIALVLIAIVASVTATYLNFKRINTLLGITGYAPYGYVNLTVSTATSLNIIATACNFGSGYILDPDTWALLESNGTNTSWSQAGTSNSIVVENDGNVNITVNVSSEETKDGFFEYACGANCLYQFWSTDNTSAGSCGSGLVNYGSFKDLDTTNLTACSNLGKLQNQDKINVHCRLNISNAVPPNILEDTWTFYAITAE